MITQANPHHAFELALVENGVCLVAFATACFWPQAGSIWFRRIERIFRPIARNAHLAVTISGLSVILLRLAILPMFPIPRPNIPDDFSFLLLADTFVSGRLTNPTPALWPHFESMHITMYPTYTSMYFPAQGLLLAAGKVLFGNPWFGLLIVDGLMCAALCWMLQAWLPRRWAFAGSMIAVIRLGLFSYWINSYTGAGCIAALGGALVLGALPRITRGRRLLNGWWLAVGISILILSRPYEGMLLCVPVAVVLGHWAFFSKDRPNFHALMRASALPLLLVMLAGSWLGYYDYRAFGNPRTLPYTISRSQYAIAPYYLWQHERPTPVYRHAVMRDFYARMEMKRCREIQSISGFLPGNFGKVFGAIQFYAGPALMICLLMFHRAVADKRIRFLTICLIVLCAGMGIEVFLVAHYLAAFTGVLYAIGLQAMRHLRVWAPGARPVGLALVRMSIAVCFVMAGIRLCSKPLGIETFERPQSEWMGMWYGPDPFGAKRSEIQQQLEGMPGKHIILVRYGTNHFPDDEWVYNAPDLEHAKVIWAREMDKFSNEQLIRYYTDRQVWLVQPDKSEGTLASYPSAELPGSEQLVKLHGNSPAHPY